MNKPVNKNTAKRFVGEVVELSRDCELGQEGDRAVVTAFAGHYMTLTFPDRAPDCRAVHTGADYKYLRAYEGPVEWSDADLGLSAKKPVDRGAVLLELRALVATYLEGSDDAPRAAKLLDALEVPAPVLVPTPQSPPTPAQESRERAMFGCTAAAIDEALTRKLPRDVAMYAMSTLSNAQELIQRNEYEGKIEWTVADRHANTLRQFINIAKYAIDKAVPR
jgi:hypothetical protein